MANIDPELAFLRDVEDYDGDTAREVICNALKVINAERSFPPNELVATHNDEYTTTDDKPYTSVVVKTSSGPVYFDGLTDNVRITENGQYWASEMFPDKTIFITGITVDVNELNNTYEELHATKNGEYTPESVDCAYSKVYVNVTGAKSPGDYCTAAMYFYDPFNPNDATMIFIAKDDHILYGESALQFLNRFPKFRCITYDNKKYYHSNWNPDPSRLIKDQDFIPVWELAPYGYADVNRVVDYDVFLYCVRNKCLEYFFTLGENTPIDVNIEGNTYSLKCINKGFTDANNVETHYGFCISSTDSLAASKNYVLDKSTSEWSFMRWNGLNAFSGYRVWTDGTDIYYSSGTNQYVLDRSNNTWIEKHWDGLSIFYGDKIWTDGTDIYYSDGYNQQYVLDEDGHTWISKTWYRYDTRTETIIETTEIDAEDIWKCDSDIYYGTSLLDKQTYTWYPQTFQYNNIPLADRTWYGRYIWTDNGHVYFNSYNDRSWELDKSTLTWYKKYWSNDTSSYFYFLGDRVWTDGTDIYYDEYKLDRNNSNWQPCKFNGVQTYVNYLSVWSDGNAVYSSYDSIFSSPIYCNENLENTSSKTPVDGDNYYWWGCSLARAQLNNDRQLLVRQVDIDTYDYCNWNINHILPQSLINDIIPVSYYINHPKQVANNYIYKHKAIPRKNLSVVQGAGQCWDRVYNPTGNPQEQGWYEYNDETENFYETTDTTVDPNKVYYYTRDYYTLEVDAPLVSDIYRKRQSTGWSDYEKNLKHSSILHIRQENGRYVPYKKIKNQFVEYTIDEHIKYVNTHTLESISDCYMYDLAMYGLERRIKHDEDLDYIPDIHMENVYYMYSREIGSDVQRYCVYLYDKNYKTYYVFDARLNDWQESYSTTTRYTIDTTPQKIAEIDANIANGTYVRTFEHHDYGASGTHGYIKEYDIWPDEEVYIYASGGYEEKNYNHYTDPETGSTYTVTFYSTIIGSNDISSYYFYNYDDIANGFNTCPPAYHFVRNGNSYTLERVETQYNGYTSEIAEYEACQVLDKITDKFIVLDITENYQKPNLYDPAYYSYKRGSYTIDPDVGDVVNTPLIERIEAVKTVESGNVNNINYIDKLTIYDKLSTYISNKRNANRNIYADEATIHSFDLKRENYYNDPSRYTLYTYDQAMAVWQNKYNGFSKDYSVRGPQNNGFDTYDKIYFYL